MKYILFCTLILCSVLDTDAQRREFHPTIDVGINGGISLSKIGYSKEFNEAGILKQFNFNVMSNAGFSRHLFEIGFANRLNDNGFMSDNPIQKVINNPAIFSLNYTFGYELFAYYPACMIRNQLLIGLRANAEYVLNNIEVEAINQPDQKNFFANDYGHYSADLSLITDYHLNKKNYVVLQVYTPIATFLSKNLNSLASTESLPTLSDRLDQEGSWFFDNMEFVWPNGHSKIGINATYRLLLNDYVAVQLKYHGKLNSKTRYPNRGIFPVEDTFYQNHHQLMVGIVGHFKRMPIGF